MSGLREHIQEIEDTYGRGIVAQGSRGNFYTHRFMSMIFDLDAAIGGGMPWGKFVLAYGPPSGGKSVLLYKYLAGAQMYCHWCRDLFWVDGNGVETCACAPGCADCKEDYVLTDYDGPEPVESDPFDWALIHDEWVCGCLVSPEGTKAKKDRVPKTTRRSRRCLAVLFDAENSFDRKWAEALGVDCDYLFVFVPEYAEQGIDIADKMLRSCEVDFLGVDSIAELVPSKEIESSMEDWQIGLHARLVNKAMRKWGASMNSFGTNAARKPIIFMVNQVRSNIGGYTEDTTPGGRGEGFKSSIRIRVNAAKYNFKESGKGATKIQELKFADISGFTQKNKCLTGDTLVYLPEEGRVASLFELEGREGLSVLGWDGTQVVSDNAQACVEQHEDAIWKVTVEGSGTLRGNKEHPILTDEGFKKLWELELGALVPVPVDLPLEDGVNQLVSVEEARLLGLLIGDGYVGGSTNVCLTNSDEMVIDEFTRLCGLYGCEVWQKDDIQWMVRHKAGGHKGKPNPLYQMLKSRGVYGKVALTKEVPPSVFKAPQEVRLSFLGALIATDGHVETGVRRVGYTTISAKLAEGARLLLASLGIRASVRKAAPTGPLSKHPCYEVRMGGRHADAFLGMNPWMGGKEKKSETWPDKGWSTHFAICPAEWANILIKQAKEVGLTAKDFSLEVGHDQTGWGALLGVRGRTAWKHRVGLLANKLDNVPVQELLNVPVDWCPITKIELDGYEGVYDICGAKTESFLANGLVVHNTYPPKKKYTARLYLSDYGGHPTGSTNEYQVVADRAIEYEVIQRPKPSQYVYGDLTWSSQKAITDALQADFGLFWKIRDETMTIVVEALK